MTWQKCDFNCELKTKLLLSVHKTYVRGGNVWKIEINFSTKLQLKIELECGIFVHITTQIKKGQQMRSGKMCW